MPEQPDRRQRRRIPLPERPAGHLRTTEEVRLLDLSLTGARLEHEQLLRPGGTCTVELPPTFGSLILPAQVVWSRVAGTVPSAEGRLLCYESGLQFPPLTSEQHALLRQGLERADSRGLEDGGRLL